MLATCLNSLVDQGVNIIIVDNDPDSHISPELPLNTVLIHEPRRGIANARNAGIEAALQMQAEWMAFIDDDMTAPEGWIRGLHTAAKKYAASAVAGSVLRIPDDRTPKWARSRRNKTKRSGIQEGQTIRVAQTNNILFKLDKIREHELRFNEQFGLRSGEDYEFFYRYTEFGAKMVRSNNENVQCIETIPRERLTLIGQTKAGYNAGHCRVVDARLLKRETDHQLRARGAKKLLSGGMSILICPLAIVLGYRRFMRAASAGTKQLAEGIGIFHAISGGEFAYYKQTTGE